MPQRKHWLSYRRKDLVQWNAWQDVICLQGNTTVDVSCGFTPFTITIPFSDVSKYFNRIGQYDFTKPEQLEGIEHIKVADNDIRCNTPIGDSLLILKNKINELVDTVNELRKERI